MRYPTTVLLSRLSRAFSKLVWDSILQVKSPSGGEESGEEDEETSSSSEDEARLYVFAHLGLPHTYQVVSESTNHTLSFVQDSDFDPAPDSQFLETLLKIKRQDSKVYDPSHDFFVEPGHAADGDGGSNSAGRTAKRKASKPVYLRQVVAEQVCV
jgi:hypothetical protein